MSKEEMNLLIQYIETKLKEFQEEKYSPFSDFVNATYSSRKDAPNLIGVYVLYEVNKPLYIGSAGGGNHFLKHRIADFLWDYKNGKKFYQTVTKKLREKGLSIDEARKFYIDRCRLRILKTETVKQARMLEVILIELLKPKYQS